MSSSQDKEAPPVRYGPANPHPLSQLKTELVWDPNFNNTQVKDGRGLASNLTYDARGNVLEVRDAPMASMYGLAARSIPTVRTTAEENARKVVRLSRPKGKAGVRKRKR